MPLGQDLLYRLRGDSGDLQGATRQAQRQLDKLQGSSEEAGEASVSAGAKAKAAWLGAAGAIAATVAATRALRELQDEQRDATIGVGERAAQTGLDFQTQDILDNVARSALQDPDALADALTTVQEHILAGTLPEEELAAIGLTPSDVSGLDAVSRYEVIAEALRAADERDAVAAARSFAGDEGAQALVQTARRGRTLAAQEAFQAEHGALLEPGDLEQQFAIGRSRADAELLARAPSQAVTGFADARDRDVVALRGGDVSPGTVAGGLLGGLLRSVEAADALFLQGDIGGAAAVFQRQPSTEIRVEGSVLLGDAELGDTVIRSVDPRE